MRRHDPTTPGNPLAQPISKTRHKHRRQSAVDGRHTLPLAMPYTDAQISVASIAEVHPGAKVRDCLSVFEFRTVLEDLASRHELATLPLPTSGSEMRPPLALALVGRWTGQIRWATPLLEALEIPGTFFVPFDWIGTPERLQLGDLEALRCTTQVRVGLDLSAAEARPSRDLAVYLRQTSDFMEHWHCTRAPYVWMSGRPWDQRLPFLSKQAGFLGLISTRPRDGGSSDGLAVHRAQRYARGSICRLGDRDCES